MTLRGSVILRYVLRYWSCIIFRELECFLSRELIAGDVGWVVEFRGSS